MFLEKFMITKSCYRLCLNIKTLNQWKILSVPNDFVGCCPTESLLEKVLVEGISSCYFAASLVYCQLVMHDLDKTSRITGERQTARQFVVPGARG